MLCSRLCMGIQPGARFHARSADAPPATLYGHLTTQAIYRNRPIGKKEQREDARERALVRRRAGYGMGVIENKHSTDGQIAINRQIDVRGLRVNAHTMVCGRSAITNRVRASV